MIDLSSQQKQSVTHNNNQLQPNADDIHLQLKPVAALRSVFNHWIRSLVMEERFLVLKIYAYPIPQILRKLLSKLERGSNERCSQIQSAKQGAISKASAFGEARHSLKEVEKAFIESLVFVCDGYDYLDHICFEFNLLKCPEKVFDLLIIPISDPSAKLIQEAINNRRTSLEITEKLRYCCSLQELAVQTINFLRRQILLRFRQIFFNPKRITQGLEDEKRRKKQFSTYFKNLSQEGKRQMLLLQAQSIQKLHQWFTFRQIKIDFAELVKEVSLLSKMEKKQFCNRIFRCKIKRLTNPLIQYHQQIYNLWKSELVRYRKRKFSRKFEQNREEQKQTQEKLSKSKAKNNKNRHQKSNSVQSNQTNVTQNKKRMRTGKRQKELNCQKSEKHQICVKIQKDKLEEGEKEAKNYVILQKSERKRTNKKKKANIQKIQQPCKTQESNRRQILKTKEIRQQQKQSVMQKQPKNEKDQKLQKINQNMIEFADKISEEANIYHDRRIIAFQRIQLLLSYYNIQIELFGSCACGIATQNSDIDIAVKSQILAFFEYLPQNLRLMGALQSLQQIFATQPFIVQIKVISTASIPIIKLKINTSVPFLDQTYGQLYERLNRKHKGGIIQADITIETLNHLSQSHHLGIISTQAINQWLAQIPSLHCIVIIMKQFFQKKGFNQTYKGGLNTFSTIVMLVAYIYHTKMQKQPNAAKVLEGILSFYSSKFDQKELGIDLLDQKSSYFFNKSQKKDLKDSREKADLQILDPKGKLKNMTRKCYLFPYIKVFFKQMLEFCFQSKPQMEKQVLFNVNDKNDIINNAMNERKNVFEAFWNKISLQQ